MSAKDLSKHTPMMQQYWRLKNQHPDQIMFYRMGDFYELFGEDAEVAARELQLTLTGRQMGNKGRIPMCGVPHHAIDRYLKTPVLLPQCREWISLTTITWSF